VPGAAAEGGGGSDPAALIRPAHRPSPFPRTRRGHRLSVVPAAGGSDHLSRRRGRDLLAHRGWRALRECRGRNAVRRVLEEASGAEDEARTDFFFRPLLSLLGRRATPGPAGTAFLAPHLRFLPYPGHHGAARLRL